MDELSPRLIALPRDMAVASAEIYRHWNSTGGRDWYGGTLLLGTIASYWHPYTLSLAARRSVRGRQSELVEPLLAVYEPPSTPISSYYRDLSAVAVPLVPLLACCKFLSTPPYCFQDIDSWMHHTHAALPPALVA